MGSIIFSVIFISILIGIPVHGQCPIACDLEQNTRTCCHNGTLTCCKSSFETELCHIDVHSTTNELYIQSCTIKNLSQHCFPNISRTSLTKFILQNVKIESIANNTFKNLRKLTTLEFNRCFGVNMASLGNAMKTMKNNHSISFSFTGVGIMNDNISSLFIGTSTFGNISLANNAIESLPLLELQNVRSLVELDLSNNKISNISLPTKAMDTLNTMKLQKNRIKQIHRNIWQKLGKTFPKLENLDLRENAIEGLENIPMSVFPALKSLNLANNHLKFLDIRLLQNLNHIEQLDFSNNWLSSKSQSVLTIRSVKRLTLRSNHFYTFPPWLCNNDAGQTSNFPNLEYLDLSNNLIQYTITQAWTCLTKLRELNLNRNPLKHIKNNTFANLTELETLHLSMLQGGLETVEQLAFNTTKLKSLNLESSGILFKVNSSLINMFKYLTQLTELNLAFNKFPDLNDSAIVTLFSPLKSITKLNLRFVGISRLPFNLLGRFPDLKTLILDDNHFETRHLWGSFQSSTSLKYLSLVHNRIAVIRKNSFGVENKQTLKEIDLSRNNLDCTCDNRWFRKELEDGQERTDGIKYMKWEQYQCSSLDNDSPKLFKDYNPTEKECRPVSEMVTAYITIACFLFVFSFTACLVYRFRWHITYWRYKMERKSTRRINPELQPILQTPTLKFDAYIIYKLDEPEIDKFIKTEFDPMVKNLGYKSFIWDRDAGFGSKISEMGDGIYGSRNVIAIVTNSFLKDTWCNFQIEVALDRQVELQRQTLMFIVMEDVDFQLLNKDWCVRFTKNPTVHWCSETNNIKRNLLEAQIQSTLGKPGPRNREAM